MASLFDSFEQQTSTAGAYQKRVNAQTDDITARNPGLPDRAEESPIFKRMKIEFRPKEKLTHLVACSNVLVMGMIDKNLIKVDLKHPDEPEELSLSTFLGPSAAHYKIHRVFLDPLGNHLFVSLEQGSAAINIHVYIGPNGKKNYYRILKDQLITAIAFNRGNQQTNSTGQILIATSKGAIYEAEYVSSEAERQVIFNKATSEKLCKRVHEMRSGMPITGIHMETVVNEKNATQCQTVVFVSTARQVYRFFGNLFDASQTLPTFDKLFASSESYAFNNSQEVPNPTKMSSLQVLVPKGEVTPTNMACLFGPVGVYHAALTESTAYEDQTVPWLQYEEEPRFLGSPTDPADGQPLSMVVTNYHIMVLFKKKLKIYRHADDSLESEDTFPTENMVGVVREPTKGLIWSFSETTVYKYKVEREDRNMWRVLLAKKKFAEAILFCRDDPVKLNKIQISQAQDLFRQGLYEKSAKLFSKSNTSFEEISLRFLEVEQDSALRILLKEKLYNLAEDGSQKAQMIMIVTWLVQMYLNKLGHLKHQMMKDSDSADHRSEHDSLKNEFHNLLGIQKVRKAIMENKKPFYKLITSHGDETLLQDFSRLMEDFDYVVQMHLQNKHFDKALEVLRAQRSPDLYYKFSANILPHLPTELVDSWMQERLDPVRLIPALVQYSEAEFDPRAQQMTESIRYLEHCVEHNHCADESIHNYLISLYAVLGDSDRLEKYLNKQGMDILLINYDAKYALRVFSEKKLLRSCVHVYSVMGLFAEAIELALNDLEDVPLSQSIANMPEEDDLKKRLWLMIAKHVISKRQDIKDAMDFLKACDLLKIEDILPFFPEFASIDHFKNDICESLQSYKGVISQLKTDMDHATKATDEIKHEIQEVKNRCFVVDRTHQCSSCGFSLLNQSFYIFPCLHRFHAECLANEAQPYLGIEDRPDQRTNAETSSQTSSQQATEKMSNDVIAAECLFCGELMADSIGQPFFERDSYEKILRQWL